MSRGGWFVLLACLCLIAVINAQKGVQVVLSAADKQTLLDLHNSVRSTANITASGPAKQRLPFPNPALPLLTWDDNLAKVWGDGYSKNCVWGHTDSTYRRTAAGKSSSVGENLSMYSNKASFAQFFAGWYNEHSKWDFHPIGQGDFDGTRPAVGHYTQLVWAGTTSVGCSLIDCTQFSNGFILACDYYGAGNMMGNTPYACTGVQDCSQIGLSCGGTYPSFCGVKGDTGVTTSCNCGTGASTTNTATANPSNTPSKTVSNSASRTSAASITPAASSTPAPSASGAPSSTSVPSLTPAPSTTSNPSVTASGSITPSPPPPSASPSSGASTTRTGTQTATASRTSAASQSKNPTTAPSASASSVGSRTSIPSQTSSTSTTPSISKSAPCVRMVCGSALNCGTFNDGCGGTITCGTCASGKTCVKGVCTVGGCNPPCKSTSEVCLSSGKCGCAPGYSTSFSGECDAALFLSTLYPFVPFFNDTPNVWLMETQVEVGSPPEISNSDSATGTRRSILWRNSNQFSSDSNTTISAQFKTGTQSVSVGVGFRLNQNVNGRLNDSIEWRLDVSGDKVTPHWIMYYYNGFNDVTTLPAYAWSTTDWNNVTIRSYATSNGRLNFNVIINGVGADRYYYTDRTYYPTVGSIYFSGSAPFGLRQVVLSTGTTITVSVAGCMSPEAWRQFVASILGTSVTIDQYKSNAACSSSNKRQVSGVEPLSIFTFTLADSELVSQPSSALASKFLAMAASNDPAFASEGVSVESAAVTYPDVTFPDSVLVAEPAAAAVVVPAAVAGGGGLSAGAIAGIAVGGSVAGLAAVGVLAGIAVAVVVVVRKRRQGVIRDVQMESLDEEKGVEEVKKEKKREGVDVFDPVDRRQSVTGRSKIQNI